MDTNNRFKTIAIVGVGLIGGSLGMALKRKGFKGTIIGIDNPYTLEDAIKRKAVDKVYPIDQLKEGVATADLVFLCTPIDEIVNLIKIVGNYVKPNTLITDVGSIKRSIVETANLHLPRECDFIGGHPMAGSEFRSIKAADPFLFENTIYVLTPTRPIDESTRKAFGELLESIGAKVLLMLPKLHDEIAAAVSHLPQMAAVAMMNMVAEKQKESPHFMKMAAGGFRDMTRIASSPYGIWEHIRQTNSDMIIEYIDAYIKELEKVKKILLTPELETYFESSAKNRLNIPSDTKGFLRPHFDISVAVEDKPGMIAIIANTLNDENINIKDIEVLKIREDEGGTIRLAFTTENDREAAISLLRAKGLECGKRD